MPKSPSESVLSRHRRQEERSSSSAGSSSSVKLNREQAADLVQLLLHGINSYQQTKGLLHSAGSILHRFKGFIPADRYAEHLGVYQTRVKDCLNKTELTYKQFRNANKAGEADVEVVLAAVALLHASLIGLMQEANLLVAEVNAVSVATAISKRKQ